MSEDKSIDVLSSETDFKLLTIQGKEFRIGKIKSIFYLRLVNAIGSIFVKGVKEIKSIGEKLNDMSEIEAIIRFTSMLDENEFAKLLSVLLNTDDIELCKNIDQYELLEIIETIVEFNDLNLFLKKAQRVIKKISDQLKDANTNS